MGEQLIPKATVSGQIIKLPEDLQFEAVRQTMELMTDKKLLEEYIAKQRAELQRLPEHCVFQATPAIPYKNKKKLKNEAAYVSQSSGEFWVRVFRKTCSNAVFLMVLLMAVKFAADCFYIDMLKQISEFISGNFLLVAGYVLAGCAILSTAEILFKDKSYSARLKKKNNEIKKDNAAIDKQNQEILKKNQQAQEEDKKRYAIEEKIHQTKREELKKLLNACEDAYNTVISGITQLQGQNVLPGMFFEDGNRMLSVVYYLMQNRITTKLYDLDGALEKARNMLLDEKRMELEQQKVNLLAQSVSQLQSLNSSMQDVQCKLDSLNTQVSSLTISQAQMNAMLADVSTSNNAVVAAIESQSNAMKEQNKALVSSIDKSIRNNPIDIYDTSLFGTHINAKDIKKFVEGNR